MTGLHNAHTEAKRFDDLTREHCTVSICISYRTYKLTWFRWIGVSASDAIIDWLPLFDTVFTDYSL